MDWHKKVNYNYRDYVSALHFQNPITQPTTHPLFYSNFCSFLSDFTVTRSQHMLTTLNSELRCIPNTQIHFYFFSPLDHLIDVKQLAENVHRQLHLISRARLTFHSICLLFLLSFSISQFCGPVICRRRSLATTPHFLSRLSGISCGASLASLARLWPQAKSNPRSFKRPTRSSSQ